MAGLEPAQLSPLRPQHSVSTNSTTWALKTLFLFRQGRYICCGICSRLFNHGDIRGRRTTHIHRFGNTIHHLGAIFGDDRQTKTGAEKDGREYCRSSGKTTTTSFATEYCL